MNEIFQLEFQDETDLEDILACTDSVAVPRRGDKVWLQPDGNTEPYVPYRVVDVEWTLMRELGASVILRRIPDEDSER